LRVCSLAGGRAAVHGRFAHTRRGPTAAQAKPAGLPNLLQQELYKENVPLGQRSL